MTEDNLFEIISSVGVALETKETVITESFVTKANDIHSSFSPLVQAEVHKASHNFFNRAKRSMKNVAPHLISYACFLFASLDAQKKLAGKSKFNVRDGQNWEDLPDYQQANIQSFIEGQKGRKKGPRRLTTAKIRPYLPQIESMASQRISSRSICLFLETTYQVKISHTTLNRYLKEQKKQNV